MKKNIVIILLAILMSACGSLTPTAAPLQPTQDVNAIYTFAAQTNQAQIPTSVPTSSPAPATATQPAVVMSPRATTITANGCSDSAQYVTDDGRDGTVYSSDTPFTKMWRIKNTGTCTWDSTYTVSFVSGTAMTPSLSYTLVPAGSTVPPGRTMDVSLDMTSPIYPGDYTAYWRIQNRAGTRLVQFYVTLKVQDSSSGEITAASTKIDLEQGSGDPCNPNASYFLTVNLTANGSTTANYRVDLTDSSGQVTNGIFSDFGSPEAKGSLTFDGAGTQKVVLRAVGPYQYPNQVTVRTYVNDQAWSTVTATCQP